MGNQLHLTYFFLLLSVIATGSAGRAYADPGFNKLFVFGDSYVDTGNWETGGPWNEPYGITYPGKPDGHFSDGRCFSEFIAAWMGIKPPTPYRFRGCRPIEHGMNFAYGGAGVFNTSRSELNMTAQIDQFKQVLKEKLYTQDDLKHSIALVATSGNDYNAYIDKGGSLLGLPCFITSVVKQLRSNLQRIHCLGVKKILVMEIQPLGCLPRFTMPDSYEKCNQTANLAARFHNILLTAEVEELKRKNGQSAFVSLDMYDAFMFAIKKHETKTGTLDTLRPCCTGITSNYSCGDVEDGVKKYNVCADPTSAFFWDSFHPTQAGWRAIYSILRSFTANPFQGEFWGSF